LVVSGWWLIVETAEVGSGHETFGSPIPVDLTAFGQRHPSNAQPRPLPRA